MMNEQQAEMIVNQIDGFAEKIIAETSQYSELIGNIDDFGLLSKLFSKDPKDRANLEAKYPSIKEFNDKMGE
jgi:hypothetical protein